jgi:transposase-like protein
VVAKAQRRKFTAEYKLSIVEEADRASDPGAIGALLRREGLYSSHLVEWRRLRAAGALSALSKKRGRKPTRNPLAEENQRLKAQVARLEKKLHQAETIIDVQKKVSALLGITLPEADRNESNS